MEAVRRLREFLATQGYLGEVASKLLFVVSIEKKRSNGEEYYEIVARLPEMEPDGRMRVKTYWFRVDTTSGDVMGKPVEETGCAP